MAKVKKLIGKGDKVSIVDEGTTYPGTVAKVKRNTIFIDFDDGDEGDFLADEVTLIKSAPTEKPGPIIDPAEVEKAKEKEAQATKEAKEAEESLRSQEGKELSEEAEALGVKPTRLVVKGFKHKTVEELEKEEARNKKLIAVRLSNCIEKAKKLGKMKPIEKRHALLVGRFKAITSEIRANTYSDKIVNAWIEEFNLIENSPKQWNNDTKNGTIPYTPGSKRKKTAKQILAGMDLD